MLIDDCLKCASERVHEHLIKKNNIIDLSTNSLPIDGHINAISIFKHLEIGYLNQ